MPKTGNSPYEMLTFREIFTAKLASDHDSIQSGPIVYRGRDDILLCGYNYI